MVIDMEDRGKGIANPVSGFIFCDGTVEKIGGQGREKKIGGIHPGVLGILDQEW
jgi:hypothetical protein